MAFLGASWGALGGLLGSCPCLARLGRPLGPNLCDLASHFWFIFVPILAQFWVPFSASFWACFLHAFLGDVLAQKLPRQAQDGAQRHREEAILLLFTMVLACRLFCCCRASWGRLAALLVRIWPLKVDFWTPKGSQNVPKICPQRALKMGPEKGTQHPANLKKKQPLSLKIFWGWRVPSVGPAGYTPTSLTNPLASTTFVPHFVLGQISDHPYLYDFPCVFACTATPPPSRARGTRS